MSEKIKTLSEHENNGFQLAFIINFTETLFECLAFGYMRSWISIEIWYEIMFSYATAMQSENHINTEELKIGV